MTFFRALQLPNIGRAQKNVIIKTLVPQGFRDFDDKDDKKSENFSNDIST